MSAYQRVNMAYRLLTALAVVLLVSANAKRAFSDVVVTVDTGNFVADSGVQLLDIFVHSTTPLSSDHLIVFFNYTDAGNAFSSPAGVFGQNGHLGFGNLDPASAFVKLAGSGSVLNLEFMPLETIPNTQTLLAQFSIDTTGLAPGFYGIGVTSVMASGDPAFTGVGGGYNVTAVPEPGSMAVLGLLGGAAAWKRRRSKAQKAAEAALAA